LIKDYDIERIFRDSLILPIYEGTSEIQAIMSVKDVLKAVMRNPKTLLDGSFSPSLAHADASGPLGRTFRRARSKYLWSIRYLLFDLTRKTGHGNIFTGAKAMLSGQAAITEEDTDYVLLHAKRLTNMLAHLHAARLLIAQANQYPERYTVAARMTANALAVCDESSRRIRSGDKQALDQIRAWQATR
jgi:hypothetical protein